MATKAPAKRVRAKRRVVAFVKPQLLQHEAVDLVDFLRAQLATMEESPALMSVRSATDELVRAIADTV